MKRSNLRVCRSHSADGSKVVHAARRGAIVLLLVFLASAGAHGQALSFRGSPYLTQDVVGTNTYVEIATDGADTWVAVWQNEGDLDGPLPADDGDLDIIASISTDNGVTWAVPIILSPNDNGLIDETPDLATDGAGNWVAVWTRQRGVAYGGSHADDQEIMFATLSTAGGILTAGAMEVLNTYMDDSAIARDNDDFQATVAYGNGQWVAAWTSTTANLYGDATGSNDSEILATYSDETPPTETLHWEDAFRLTNTGQAVPDRRPSLAYDDSLGDRLWVVVWEKKNDYDGLGPDLNDYDIFFQTSPSLVTAGSWSLGPANARSVNEQDSASSHISRWPRVQADGSGNWVVVWESEADSVQGQPVGSDWDILAAYSSDPTASVAPWSATVLVNSFGDSDSALDNQVDVHTDGAGYWMAAWQSEYDDDPGQPGSSGADTDIWAALSEDNGQTWYDARLASDNDVHDGYPHPHSDERGIWLVAAPSKDSLDGAIPDTDNDILLWKELPPEVSQIIGNAAPQNLATGRCYVAFTDPVIGADETDFELTNPGDGLAGHQITAVNPYIEDENNGVYWVYEVVFLTGEGEGILQLNVLDDDTIIGTLDQPLAGLLDGFYAGSGPLEVFYVDRIAPQLQSIDTPASYVSGSSVTFDVSFDETVRNFDATEVVVNASDLLYNPTVTVDPLASASEFEVTVDGITATAPDGAGTLSITVVDFGNIEDLASNLLSGSLTSADVVVDQGPPAVVSVVPETTGPTNADELLFTVSFDEMMMGFDLENDLVYSHSGTANSGALLTDTGDQQTFEVLVQLIEGDGSFTLEVNRTSDVTDLAGNPLDFGAPSPPVFIDNTAPEVLSIVPATTGPTTADDIDFTVTFDDDMQGFDAAADVVVTHTGTANTGVSIVDTGDQRTFSVAVEGITGDGSLSLDVDLGSDVADVAGNPVAATAPSVDVLIDNTPPEVQSITAPGDNPTNAEQLLYVVDFGEPVLGVNTSAPFDDFAVSTTDAKTLAGAAVDSVTDLGTSEVFEVVVNRGTDTGNGTVRLDVLAAGGIQDAVGNPMASNYTGGAAYTISELAFDANLPSEVEVTEGDPLTLSLTATGGVGTKTYLWYFDDDGSGFELLSGFDTDTVSFPAAEMGHAGAYYCVVSDDNESVQSNEATVLVNAALSVSGAAWLAMVAAIFGATAAARMRRKK